jgi:hypothetical protein
VLIGPYYHGDTCAMLRIGYRMVNLGAKRPFWLRGDAPWGMVFWRTSALARGDFY